VKTSTKWQKSLFGLVAVFAIVSTFYIIISDQIVFASINGDNPDRITFIQTIKGATFVLLTTVLLFFLIRWFIKVNHLKENEFQLMFWQNPSPMWIYDLGTLQFLDVNDAAISQYGYTREEFLRMSIKDIRPPNDVPKLLDSVMKTEEGFSPAGTWRHLKKDGSIIYVDVYGFVIDYRGQEAKLIMSLNVTDRVMMQRERNQLTKLLLERNHQIQGLAYSLSHNFRAPVVNLKGLNTLLQKQIKDGEETSECLKMQDSALETLDQTIRDLTHVLETTGTLAQSREQLELKMQFDVVHRLFMEQLEQANAEVSIDFSRTQVVLFNRQVLASMFFNLLSNAIKFRHPDRPLAVTVSSEAANGHTIIRFEDNGVGMDEAIIQGKIFQMYQRFHLDKPGRGLGLYLIKYQLQELNSSIDVRSRKGEGTRFEVVIPHS
jgi:PAS domain S-box-containing protein